MLYIFAGFPKSGINAGGIRHGIGRVLGLPILEERPDVQCRKEGIFIRTPQGEERLRDTDYHISQRCVEDGITWKWFTDNWAFGNGVTIHKTYANYESKTVVHGTNLPLDEYLQMNGATKLSEIKLERVIARTEGLSQYQSRWTAGRCPTVSHIIHLTWLVTNTPLHPVLYQDMVNLIENGASVAQRDRYEDKHFSQIRTWVGASHYGNKVPVGSI